MAGPLRTVIGHGRILAHLNLPVETLISADCFSPITTGTADASLNAREKTFKIFYEGSRNGPRPGPGTVPDRPQALATAARRRCLATRSRFPQTSLEHQRRRRPREVSR